MVENTHYAYVTASLTELQRTPRKVIGPVRKGQIVTVTDHGEAIAEIRPVTARRRPPTEAEIEAAAARIPVVRDVTWEQIRAETREA